jgi:hypothetical protein
MSDTVVTDLVGKKVEIWTDNNLDKKPNLAGTVRAVGFGAEGFALLVEAPGVETGMVITARHPGLLYTVVIENGEPWVRVLP